MAMKKEPCAVKCRSCTWQGKMIVRDLRTARCPVCKEAVAKVKGKK